MRMPWRRSGVVAIVASILFIALYVVGAHISLWGRRESRHNGMQMVIMTLANYCDVHKRLPLAIVKAGDGAPLASGRMAVLVYSPAGCWGTEDTDAILGNDFDLTRSWDDQRNQSVTRRIMSFCCFRKAKADRGTDTNVFAITGRGTAFDPDMPHRLTDLPGDTVVLIEVSGTRVPWAAPGDCDIARLPEQRTLIPDSDGFYVAFADQSVWRLRNDVPFEIVSKFFLIDGAQESDRDQELGPYRLD